VYYPGHRPPGYGLAEWKVGNALTAWVRILEFVPIPDPFAQVWAVIVDEDGNLHTVGLADLKVLDTETLPPVGS